MAEKAIVITDEELTSLMLSDQAAMVADGIQKVYETVSSQYGEEHDEARARTYQEVLDSLRETLRLYLNTQAKA